MVGTPDIGAASADGSYFPGAGWTGQPLLVKWPKATNQAMKLPAAQVDDDGFVEVIYPVFDGSVYRLSLADGSVTRPKIEGKWGFKGTGSIDPRGYPLLYAGQGLNENGNQKGPWEYRIFDLIQNKQVSKISGADEVSHRQDPVGWGAFDSSALIDRYSDTLIEPGENGIVYKAKLNASFDAKAGKPALLCTSSPVCGKNVALEHDGRVYSCDHFVYPEHEIGRLGERPFAEIVVSLKQLEFGRNKHNSLPGGCRARLLLRASWAAACVEEYPAGRAHSVSPQGCGPGARCLSAVACVAGADIRFFASGNSGLTDARET